MGIIMAVTLIFFLGLSAAQAIFDVSREEGSIDNLLNLQKKIHNLSKASDEDFQNNLQEIIDYCHENEFRHLHLTIRDAYGRLLLDLHPADSQNLYNSSFSKIAHLLTLNKDKKNEVHTWESGAGANKITFEMYSNPISEQNEIAQNLIFTILILVSFSLVVFFATRRNLYTALRPLEDSLVRLKELGVKNYSGVLPPNQIDEVSKINEAINLLGASLIDLEKSRQMLSVKLISSVEEDRLRISRDMHDELGQKLAMIRLNIGYLDRALKDNSEISAVLSDIKSCVTGIHQSVKSIISKISHIDLLTVLDDVPFDEVIVDLIRSWEKLPSNQIKYSYSVNLGNQALSKTIKLILFRITQEAITNVVKHSSASNIVIKVDSSEEQIFWSVEDDGVGKFDETTFLQKGNGLSGMQERIWSIGGHLEIINNHKSGKGFMLKAKLPFVSN